MIRTIFAGLGKLALAAATMAFLTAVTLLVASAFLTTFPLLRISPRERRLKAAVELAGAGLAMMGAVAAGRGDTDDA
jgi:hypothetical protein